MQSAVRTREDFAPYRVDAFVDTLPNIVDAIAAIALNGGVPRA